MTKRKYYKTKGGFIPAPIKAPAIKDGIKNYLSSPQGQAVYQKGKSLAMGYAMKALKDYVRVTPNGVAVTVSKTMSPRKVSTPAVYGAYGSMTSTLYVEGKNYVPKRIKEGGKNVDFDMRTLNIEGPTAAQSVGQYQTLPASKLLTLANNYARLYTSSRTAVNSGRFFVDYAESELKITNSSNVGVTVDIYEIVARENIDEGTGAAASPTNAWTQGYTDASPTGIVGTSQTVASALLYGARPFDSDTFTQYYVVKRIFTVELPPTSTHIHKSRYNISKTFDSSLITNGSSTGSIKHITKWTMIVCKGNPIHSTANSDIVTSGPTCVDVAGCTRIVTYGNPGNDTIVGYSTTYSTVADPQVYTTNTTEQAVVTD